MDKNRKMNALESKRRSYFGNDKYYDLLIEQYRLYFERLSEDRRRSDNSTKFFLTLATFLATAYLYVLEGKVVIDGLEILILLFPSLLFCILWFFLFRAWDQMGKAQYEVIEEMESHLPMQPFTYEWYDKLNAGHKYGKRSWLRKYLPLVMALFYLLVSVYIYIKKESEMDFKTANQEEVHSVDDDDSRPTGEVTDR